MPSNPSSKWFWNDWDNDKALHLCSFAAQGLWMRMLSIAARAIPLGYVTINGRPVDATDLAQLTGKSEAEVRCLVDELEGRGVFSRDRHHRIYNRRMVRDDRRRREAVQNGKKGGNPALRQVDDKAEENSRGLSPPLTPPLDPLYPIPSTLKKEKKSSPIGERKETCPTRLPDGFVVSEEWKRDGEEAAAKHGRHPDIEVEADLFANHEWRRPYKDWRRTWINWCLNAKSNVKANGNGRHKLSPGEKLFLGFAQAAEGDFGADSEAPQPLLDR